MLRQLVEWKHRFLGKQLAMDLAGAVFDSGICGRWAVMLAMSISAGTNTGKQRVARLRHS